MMNTTFIYKEVHNCTIKGDFYPITKKNAPLIVYIHGGGLIWGEKSDINQEQIKRYHQAGFNVCSIDYRLAPETKLPDIASDIEDALIWLQTEGKDTYHFNPQNIALIGSSAGGYLALLAGAFDVKPKAIVSFYGYGDILADWYTKPSPHFTKMTMVPEALPKQLIQQKPLASAPIERRYAIYLHYRQQGKWLDHVMGQDPVIFANKIRQYCPVHLVDANYPATLLLHGDQDKDVPHDESVKMSDTLTTFGVENQLITIPNGEHLFDQNMKHPDATQAIEQVINFLQKNLS